MPTRMRILQCYVTSTLHYGCECWTISAEIGKKLKATEMWFLRKMLRRAGTERSWLRTIRRRQMEFLGHVMRIEGLENLILTGRIEGRRDRGRQRRTFLGVLKEQVAKN